MEAAPDDRMAVQQRLNLLTSTDLLFGVTLAHQLPGGMARITVRKSAQPHGQRTQEHYWWEARATTGGRCGRAPGTRRPPRLRQPTRRRCRQCRRPWGTPRWSRAHEAAP